MGVIVFPQSHHVLLKTVTQSVLTVQCAKVSREMSNSGLHHIYGRMASLYAMAVVTWYLAMAATKIITYESYFQYLDEDIFEAGLLLPAIAFLAYVIGFTTYQNQRGEWNSGRMVTDNDKSHVCAVVRIGSVFFSIGYLVYLFLELITVAEEEAGSPCYNPLRATVCCLNMTFVVLQGFLIFYYPRLNLSISPVIDRFGTMHLMATNLSLWIHIVIKESILEIGHIEDGHATRCSGGYAEDGDCPPPCDGLDSAILGDQTLAYVNPYLFPCAIEFALIGACFFIAMSKNIGKIPQGKSGDLHKIAAPDPESYFNHRDHRHCFKGSLVGGMFLIASFISLGIYVTWTLQGVKEYDTSYLYKVTSLLMTCTGIITAVIGLVQIQAVSRRSAGSHDNFDSFLLHFTSAFILTHFGFTFYAGVGPRHVRRRLLLPRLARHPRLRLERRRDPRANHLLHRDDGWARFCERAFRNPTCLTRTCLRSTPSPSACPGATCATS